MNELIDSQTKRTMSLENKDANILKTDKSDFEATAGTMDDGELLLLVMHSVAHANRFHQ